MKKNNQFNLINNLSGDDSILTIRDLIVLNNLYFYLIALYDLSLIIFVIIIMTIFLEGSRSIS